MDVRTERNKSSAGFLLTDAQDNLRVVMIDPVTGESVLPSGVPTDERGFVLAPRTSFRAKRGTTATNGVYSNVGKLNVAPNGTVGKRGDRITKLRAEVKAVSNGAKAAIYLTQLSDSIHGMNLGVSVGSAVQAGTSLTLNTNGTSIANAPANYLDGRLVTFLYQPANSPVPHWGMTRIVSHAAITTNSFTLTVEDTLEEGGVITEWWIHGPRARRLMEPSRAPSDIPYEIDLDLVGDTGPFQLWFGTAIVDLDLTGDFSG